MLEAGQGDIGSHQNVGMHVLCGIICGLFTEYRIQNPLLPFLDINKLKYSLVLEFAQSGNHSRTHAKTIELILSFLHNNPHLLEAEDKIL